MRYDLLAAVVATASFAVASGIASFASWMAWPALWQRLAQRAPAARARAIVRFRLWPSLFAAFVSSIFFVAFIIDEPRDAMEHVGVILCALSILAATWIGAALVRWLGDVFRARAFRAAVRMRGTPCRLGSSGVDGFCLDEPAPLLSLVGGVHPIVVVSRGVLDQVTEEELEIMVRHELAHRHRGDNWVAALLHALPDPLVFTRRGRAIVEAWRAAAEEAADDAATGESRRSRLVLAGALVRLAQRAHHGTYVVAASALLSGTGLERRVRRLLDDLNYREKSAARAAGQRFRSRLAHVAVLCAVASLVLFATQGAPRDEIYEVVELAVSTLP